MKLDRVFGIAMMFAAITATSRAAAQVCTPAVVIAENTALPAPQGHTQIALVNPATNAPVAGFGKPVAGSWTPTAQDIADIAAAQKNIPGNSLKLHWSGGPGAAPVCDQSFSFVVPIVPPPPPATLAVGTGVASRVFDEGECPRAGMEWRQELRRRTGGDRFTEIVFLENHDVCYRNRDFGVTGDPIFVGVFTQNSAAWDTATTQFEPCSIEQAEPNVLISDKGSVLSGFQNKVIGWKLRTYPERTCFNSPVAVTVKTGIGSTTVTARTSVEQATRYRATLNLGSAFTTLHDRSFALRPDGTDSRIYGQGPDNTGPEYYAAVVLYALPRYIPTLFGGHYAGRDVVHESTLLDRIGGVVGVGLKDPRKQFVTGFALETIPGVNVTGTWYFSRVTRLAGVNEGDVFTAAADKIPTRQVWNHDFAWGVSLDLRYVSALVTR